MTSDHLTAIRARCAAAQHAYAIYMSLMPVFDRKFWGTPCIACPRNGRCLHPCNIKQPEVLQGVTRALHTIQQAERARWLPILHKARQVFADNSMEFAWLDDAIADLEPPK